MKQGKEYENSLLGRLLSVSCLAPVDGSTAEFFDRPTRLSQPEVDTMENMIYQVGFPHWCTGRAKKKLRCFSALIT